MSDVITEIPELLLTTPIPDRDAVFALAWFDSENGRDTLLKMGNAPDEIEAPTLEGERSTIEEFLTFEKEGKQKTWMLLYEEVTIGAAWIDLVENHGVKAPSVHLMIGDPIYRGRGFGKATMNTMVSYLKGNGNKIVYSRHLVNNVAVTRLNQSLGFIPDGHTYVDQNGLEWQNIKLILES